MADVRLSAGVIEYHDTGGDGPVVDLLHGVAMDGSLWDVVAGLGDQVRCIVPTLPLGGHRRPMETGADLSVPAGAERAGDPARPARLCARGTREGRTAAVE